MLVDDEWSCDDVVGRIVDCTNDSRAYFCCLLVDDVVVVMMERRVVLVGVVKARQHLVVVAAHESIIDSAMMRICLYKPRLTYSIS